MTERNQLDHVFFPRNVAVIGASPTEFYVKAMMLSNMRDRLYMVNPNYNEVEGRKCYASVLDIEGPVDYAILNLPARFVLKAVEDCISKGVKVVHSYTAGFGETGLEEGIRLEKELAALVKGRIRLVGPNCMGIYCPKSGLSFNSDATNEPGHIGVISQSGSFAQAFVYAGRTRNVKISKMVSYGNAVDLDCPDYLEYMADDPDTNMIALYIEGISDGRRLLQALRYAAQKKPVFALKGGVTSLGGRVANSHTGALAGSGETWATVFKQSGVVQVNDINDLINISESLNDSPLPGGRGVSIITYSGGFSVVQSDMCAKAGLDVPKFSPTAVKRLMEFMPTSGTQLGNPLDSWHLFYRWEDKDNAIVDVFKIISNEEDIHSIIVQFDVISYMVFMWRDLFEERYEKVIGKLLEGCRYAREVKGKPVFISMSPDPYSEEMKARIHSIKFKKLCEKEGIPVLPSLHEAVNTIAYIYQYTGVREKRMIAAGTR